MSKKIPVEVSARHLHLTKEVFEALFGEGKELHYKRELSQPGEYLCEERVDVVGPKRTLSGVSILGPFRKYTQVEISLTDARSIGVAAPIRGSGDLVGSAGCKLVGPVGEVELKEGVIAAMRHIHTTPEVAAELGVGDNEIVNVKITTDSRSLIFGDVLVRAHPSYGTSMHIDTDEAGAAGAAGELFGEIVKF